MKTRITTSQGEIAAWDSAPEAEPDAPTILFLHGHLANKHFFSAQVDAPLLQKFRLIFVDLPGYGESAAPLDPDVYSWPGYAEIVKEAIERLGLKNLIVVGWSLGGHVALELTSRLHQLKGILIFGTPPIETSQEGFRKGFKIADPKIAKLFGKGNLTQEEAEIIASQYDFLKDRQFCVDAVHQTSEQAKTLYPQSIQKGVGQNELEIVRSWPKPIAVIVGKEETIVNIDYIINEVHFRNLWRGKVIVIEKAGHPLHMEQPAEFNAWVKAFAEDLLV